MKTRLAFELLMVICGACIGYVGDANISTSETPIAPTPIREPIAHNLDTLSQEFAAAVRERVDFQSIGSLPPETLNLSRFATVEQWCRDLSHEQLIAALGAAKQCEDRRLSGYIIRACLNRLPAPEAWNLLSHCPDYLREEVSREIAGRYGESDRGAAIDAIRRSKLVSQAMTQGCDAFWSWAEKEPERAAQWIGEKLADVNDRTFPEFFQQIYQGNSLESAKYIAQLLSKRMAAGDHRFDEAIEQLGYQWALTDAPGAFEWAKKLELGAVRNRTLRSIGDTAARLQKPQIAIAIADSLNSFQARADLYETVAEQMTKTDAAQAKTWANNIANPLLRAAIGRALDSVEK